MTQTILCKHCQGSIKDTDRFCYYCGKPVNDEGPTTTGETPEAGMVNTVPPNVPATNNITETPAVPLTAFATPDVMPVETSGSTLTETPAAQTNGFTPAGVQAQQAAMAPQISSAASDSVLPPSDFAVQTGVTAELSNTPANNTPSASGPAFAAGSTTTQTAPAFQTGAPVTSGIPQTDIAAQEAIQPPPSQPLFESPTAPLQPVMPPQYTETVQPPQPRPDMPSMPSSTAQPQTDIPAQTLPQSSDPVVSYQAPPPDNVVQPTPSFMNEPALMDEPDLMDESTLMDELAMMGEPTFLDEPALIDETVFMVAPDMPQQNALEPEPPVAPPSQSEAPIRINTTLEEDLKLEMQESQPVQSSIPFQEPVEEQKGAVEESVPPTENEEISETTAAPIPANRKNKKDKAAKTKPAKTVTRLKADPLAKAKMHAKTKAQEKPLKVKKPRPPFYYLLPHISTLFSIIMLLLTMISFYGFNSKAGMFLLFPIWPLGLLLFAALMFVTPLREMSGRKIVNFFVKLTLFFNAVVCILVVFAMVTGQQYDMLLVLVWCGGGFFLPLIIMFTNFKSMR